MLEQVETPSSGDSGVFIGGDTQNTGGGALLGDDRGGSGGSGLVLIAYPT